MSQNSPYEEIKVESSAELIEKTWDILSKSNLGIDCLFAGDFSAHIDPDRLFFKLTQLKTPRLKLRLISEIGIDLIPSYREFVKYFEIRHLDQVCCNFVLVDETEFVAYLYDMVDKIRLLRISDRSFVTSQRFLFDSLWSIAVPLKERIKEIEYGHEKSFTVNLTRPLEIVDQIRTSISSTIDEILVLFAESRVLIRSEKAGILSLLDDAASRGIKVRIIVHTENSDIKDQLKVTFHEKFPNISVQYLRKELQTKRITMVFDRHRFLEISTSSSPNQNFEAIIGLCVYSNNEIKIKSLISIFEFLWIQSDIDDQKVIKEVYFQLFKGFKLQDESYKWDWIYKSKENQK